jgi:hypothetical protein
MITHECLSSQALFVIHGGYGAHEKLKGQTKYVQIDFVIHSFGGSMAVSSWWEIFLLGCLDKNNNS